MRSLKVGYKMTLKTRRGNLPPGFQANILSIYSFNIWVESYRRFYQNLYRIHQQEKKYRKFYQSELYGNVFKYRFQLPKYSNISCYRRILFAIY